MYKLLVIVLLNYFPLVEGGHPKNGMFGIVKAILDFSDNTLYLCSRFWMI
jgi:hypothetical protein